MPRFIRVTKDNRNKDRGFIAVDAICAVFENQDSHNTEIMTMDGFWYEVVDVMEKVYEDVTGVNKSNNIEDGKSFKKEDVIENTGKFQFAKNRRFVTPAVSEDSNPKSHEVTRAFKRRNYSYPKKGYSQKKYGCAKDSRTRDFPSGEGKGQNGFRTKAEDFTPPEPE